MSKHKCKTCGRGMSYGYCGGHGGSGHWHEQKVGNVSRDSWLSAIEKNCTITGYDTQRGHWRWNDDYSSREWIAPEDNGNVEEDRKKCKTIHYETPNNSQGGVPLFCRQSCLYHFIAYHYPTISNLPNIVDK
jgi:hypothetical protein